MKPAPLSPVVRSASDRWAASSLLWIAGSLSAQTTAPAPAPPEGVAELPEILVEGEQGKVYKPDRVQTPKYTQPLRDIPQTVTVVPQSVIQERNATSLRDVLRNVPGITLQAGEGGVPTGDNMSIRGFNARTDLFVDGIRDFGGYTRDPFNMEQVEVTKGPASSNAGRGSTGGSINLASKTPRLDPSYSGETGVGTDDYVRSTADVNQPLGEHSALRVNALYHEATVPGRGVANEQRQGLAASLAFGLETDTRLILSHFHMDSEGLPDYGIPWVPAPSTAAGVTTTYLNGLGARANDIPDVSFDNFYGLRERDYERIRTDIATVQFEHDFNDNLRFTNTFRAGQTERDSVTTAPRFADVQAGPNITYDGTINRNFQSRDQTDRIIADQVNLIAKFETGLLRHDLVAGAEVVHETSKNFGRVVIGGTPTTTIGNPDPDQNFTGRIRRSGAYTESEALSLSAYLFDTVSLGDHWQLTGGLRYDRFDIDYSSVASTGAPAYAPGARTNLSRVDEMVSWRAGLVYKPVENGSVYLGCGTSFNPSAEGLTLNNTATAANNVNLDPEQSHTLELGTKWDLLQDRLQLTAAVFRTDKTHARTEDPADPTDTVVLDGEQRVQGIEFGFAGSLTDDWRVFGGYTLLDSEVVASNNPREVGRALMNTPRHSANLWTVYDLPRGFQVGAGLQFTDSRFNSNNDAAREAPSFCLFDAMVGYAVNQHFSLRLNLYNLADKPYIDRVGGGHFVPGAGRSAVLTASYRF